jgi:iron complex transport system ATP-binding protein
MGALRAYAAGGPTARPRLVIAVLHDLTLAARFCSRVLLMNDGAIVADGAPGDTLVGDPVRKHYRVEPLITRYEGEPVIVPWRPLRD